MKGGEERKKASFMISSAHEKLRRRPRGTESPLLARERSQRHTVESPCLPHDGCGRECVNEMDAGASRVVSSRTIGPSVWLSHAALLQIQAQSPSLQKNTKNTGMGGANVRRSPVIGPQVLSP